MSSLSPIGAEGEAHRDAALSILRIRRADLIRDLSDSRILQRAGFRTSSRPIAHVRPLSVWRLADAAGAVAWLAAHPHLLPEPAEAPPHQRGLFG